VRRSIEKATELRVRRLAIPAISTGIYGYPYETCAEVMTEVVKEMRDINMELLVCLFSQEAYNIFSKIFSKD